MFSSCKKEIDTPEISKTYYTFPGKIGRNDQVFITGDNATIVSNDNNLLLCGNIVPNISVLKLSKTGKQIWRNDFSAGYENYICGIAESSTEDIFICGYTSRNYSVSMRDVLLIKTNSDGDTLWTKTFGGTNDDFGYQIINTNDGNLLICGISYSYTISSFCDIYLIKINSNGDTLWTKTYLEQDQQIPFHLMQTLNGEYLITGSDENNSDGYSELYLLKVSANGTPLWMKIIGPPTWKWGFSTVELSNGDLVICGRNSPGTYSQVLLVKTDEQGNESWEKEFGINDLSLTGNSIKENTDGTFIITGSSYDISDMHTDIILLKVDQNGSQIFLKNFGSSADDSGICILKDDNDDNIIIGNYNRQIFIARTDNNGIFK